MIYLDNAATTKLAPEVLEAMMPYLTENYGNSGSIHTLGRISAEAIKKARRQVANLLSCKPEQVIFTSGGSEGNNLVIKGLRNRLIQEGKTHIITSAMEHHSVLHPLEVLNEDGFDITYVKPLDGNSIGSLEIGKVLRSNTGLVSIMAQNNETGTQNYIYDIAESLEETGIFVHSDQVQAGYCRENLGLELIDFCTISAHKFHGPKGIGVVYAKNPSLLQPLISGGMAQEFGLRGGTENIPAIVGMGEACALFKREIDEEERYLSYFDKRVLFLGTLNHGLGAANEYCHNVPKETGVHINCNSTTTENILNLRIEGVLGETLALMMDSKGVCISAGSACTSNNDQPSHVLLAYGLSEDEARSSVRISFSKYTTSGEVVEAARIMAECILRLREN